MFDKLKKRLKQNKFIQKFYNKLGTIIRSFLNSKKETVAPKIEFAIEWQVEYISHSTGEVLSRAIRTIDGGRGPPSLKHIQY